MIWPRSITCILYDLTVLQERATKLMSKSIGKKSIAALCVALKSLVLITCTGQESKHNDQKRCCYNSEKAIISFE